MILLVLLLLAVPVESGLNVIQECREQRVEAIKAGISESEVNRLYLECLEDG